MTIQYKIKNKQYQLIFQSLSSHSIAFGILYWLVWTVILPRLGGYRLEEKQDVLDDGTTITVLARVPKAE